MCVLARNILQGCVLHVCVRVYVCYVSVGEGENRREEMMRGERGREREKRQYKVAREDKWEGGEEVQA